MSALLEVFSRSRQCCPRRGSPLCMLCIRLCQRARYDINGKHNSSFLCCFSAGNEGMTPINHPRWLPFRESPGSFPTPGRSFPTQHQQVLPQNSRCWIRFQGLMPSLGRHVWMDAGVKRAAHMFLAMCPKPKQEVGDISMCPGFGEKHPGLCCVLVASVIGREKCNSISPSLGAFRARQMLVGSMCSAPVKSRGLRTCGSSPDPREIRFLEQCLAASCLDL